MLLCYLPTLPTNTHNKRDSVPQNQQEATQTSYTEDQKKLGSGGWGKEQKEACDCLSTRSAGL